MEKGKKGDNFESLSDPEKIERAKAEWRKDHIGLRTILILIPLAVLAAGAFLVNKTVIVVGGILAFASYMIGSDREMSYIDKRCFKDGKEDK